MKVFTNQSILKILHQELKRVFRLATQQYFRNQISLLIIFLALFLIVVSGISQNNLIVSSYTASHQPWIRPDGDDSAETFHYMNGSSLRRLPSVIRDLSVALNESGFLKELLGDKKNLSIYLYDVTCNSFEFSAAVQYRLDDSIYHIKLNRFNRLATDLALAVTLIHETMHCVLMDINNRARKYEKEAMLTVLSFPLNINDTTNSFDNEFFDLMNRGELGQHELMYRLFFPQMISLLERFAVLHHNPFLRHENAGLLMWSGLQNTDAYKKLTDERKQKIEMTILIAKGIGVDETTSID